MRARRRRRVAVAVVAVAAVVMAVLAYQAIREERRRPSAASTTSTTAAPDAGSEVDLLAGLEVRTSDPVAPYVRDRMDGGGWDFDPSTGCNTRELVLIEESRIDAEVDGACRTTKGEWRSFYDGVVTKDPADLEVDHFVPLADAWRSGAASWSPARRLAFANDTTSPDTLIAVTGATNSAKGDSTPDVWLPDDPATWCTYAQMWVRVKSSWDLSITQPEKDRLTALLAAC